MDKSISQEILSDIIVFNKYAKYLPELERRETWEETCTRLESMFIDKYPQLNEDIIKENIDFIRRKEVLASMRAMQFSGGAINKNNSRIYNCAYLPIEDYTAFSEVMFLLLGGTGVGYSVQKHHIDKLPPIKKYKETRKYLIGDSIEGWADAVKALIKGYFGISPVPIFNYSDIRAKGHRLVTAGGKAPGPEPLRVCLDEIREVLENRSSIALKKNVPYYRQLTTLEVHDILCHIANAVLAGGIRRAAMIALFSSDDKEMLNCKSGEWWITNEQRGRANNSVVLDRNKVTKQEFIDLWKSVEDSNCGEPGFYFTNDINLGTNPCCEISLRPYQFCNLTEVDVSNINSQKELNKRVKAATIIGTLQAGFTDFHYLRPIWRQTTEEDALIGVGMTGIASGNILKLDLFEASTIVKETNREIANIININIAARTTTIKPSGTTSLVLGTSSGIHAYHSEYYIRRIRINKNEALYTYLSIYHPELIEDDKFRPDTQAVISIPQESPKGSILRTESALDLLERVRKFNIQWIKPGHRTGLNTNNVSATISIKENEWKEVGQWMWDNKYFYNGISVLPYNGGSYVQAPFQDCTKEEYYELYKSLKSIDLSKVIELDDNTDLTGESACSGSGCEIK